MTSAAEGGRVAALLTCHNRRDSTLACLRSLRASALAEGARLDIVLVDDASTDGTAAAVGAEFPEVTVLSGSGQLFWSGGMRLALARAAQGNYEFFWWVNDDTILYASALSQLLATYHAQRHRQGRAVIVVGTTCDPRSGLPTYGGLRRLSVWRPLALELVAPATGPIACDTMNCNCVLVPRAVIDAIGNLDRAFVHAMADIDYGFRARKSGFPIWVMPGFAGECSRNSSSGTYLDLGVPVSRRAALLFGPKGLPFRAWTVLSLRHGGIVGPLLWLKPYLTFLLRLLSRRISLDRNE